MSSVSASLFSSWQNFYVIVGSAAGALTGLQFVVIALLAQFRAAGEMGDIRAFGTPTVVHFCTALFAAALMVVPWQEVAHSQACLTALGSAGVIYSIRVVWHARRAAYSPDVEDWIWYTALPTLAHLALVAAATLLRWNATRALFVIAAVCLVFLTVGIHNSWDTVTYIAVRHGRSPEKRAATSDSQAASQTEAL